MAFVPIVYDGVLDDSALYEQKAAGIESTNKPAWTAGQVVELQEVRLDSPATDNGPIELDEVSIYGLNEEMERVASQGQAVLRDSSVTNTFQRKMDPFRLIELGSTRAVECTLTPTEFSDSTEVEYQRYSSQGSSYPHMHFVSTKAYTVQMDIYWTLPVVYSPGGVIDGMLQRKLLLSWLYPRQRGRWSYGPPRLLAVWPQVFSLHCYLTECKFANQRFALDGSVTRWVATIKLEDCRETFISNDNVADAFTLIGAS